MKIKFFLLLVLCFPLKSLFAQDPDGTLYKPYTSIKISFQPRDFAVSGKYVFLAGRYIMTDHEDSIADGGFGDTGFYPELVILDTSFRHVASIPFPDQGCRNQFKQIQPFSDSSLIALQEGKQRPGSNLLSRLVILDLKGNVKKQQIIQSEHSECYFKRLKPNCILVGYTKRMLFLGNKDSVALCLQLLNDSLEVISTSCNVVAVPGNGYLVKDAVALEDGFLIGTNLGLNKGTSAAFFRTNEKLVVQKSVFMYTHHSSGIDKMVATEQGSVFLGIDAQAHDVQKGASIAKLDNKLDTVFTRDIGTCYHDNITSMLIHNDKLVVSCESGDMSEADKHMKHRSCAAIFDFDGKMLSTVIFGDKSEEEKSVGIRPLGNHFIILNRTDHIVEYDQRGNYDLKVFYSSVLRKVDQDLQYIDCMEFGNF